MTCPVVTSLTLDDGPEDRWTDAVLDALADAGARATFFVLGEKAARRPGLVGRTLAEGHEIGLHGDRHLRHTEHGRDEVERDTDAALARLEALGVRPSLWRLPWGKAAPWSAELAAERGLRIVGWDADTHDWRGDSAEAMLAAVAPALRPGCVVLAHDGLGPGARRDGCEETTALIGPLVVAARERGLACLPVGENPDVTA
jgi:peptidoglycan/xylan/chitin deacetylase (PgdA/CDA1 family)